MTRIVEIAGNRPSVVFRSSEESRQRAALVKPTADVDTANMSEGEMRLYLKAQRYKMLAEYWQGTPQGQQYQADFERARDALYNGLHVSVGLNYLPERLMSQPASRWLPWEAKARQPKQGIQNLFDDAPAIAGIGDIPQLDCWALYPYIDQSQYPGQSWVATANQINEQKRNKCFIENDWRASLNTYWESSGHSFLYEFINPVDFPLLLPVGVGEKKGRHNDVLSLIANGSKISRANLRLWQENGILAQNIQGWQGTHFGPLTPVEFIKGISEPPTTSAGGIKGFPLAAMIPVAIAMVVHTFSQAKKFFNVISGKTTLREAMKAHAMEIGLFIEKYGSDILMVAATDDWRCQPGYKWDGKACVPDSSFPGGGTCSVDSDCPPGFYCDNGVCVPIDSGNNGQNNDKTLLYGALAAGALLLAMPMNDSKK